MRDFSALFRELDQTTSTNRKVAAMVDYFQRGDPADCAWAVYFLSGNRVKRLVNTRLMREWVGE
ncbi:MAG: ATP-dependent DNA ligase, partial [Xanthomonadales bacterium]|nr:ATP-dependent DNA ligase [Xanthomonadales bacterium]